MTLQKRINELFNKFNLSLSTIEKSQLMAEATLENGTIVYTDAEGFEDGAEVYIVNEEGEKIPLPLGEYTLDSGEAFTIAEGGKIVKQAEGKGEGDKGTAVADGNAPKTKKPAAAPEKPPVKKKASKQDKLAEGDEVEEEVEEEIKEEEQLMDEAAIVELINRILDERFPAEIVEEEMSAEDKAITELKSLLESQTEELTTLKSQAASEGVKRVGTTKETPKVDMTNLSTEDRVKALFNKFNS